MSWRSTSKTTMHTPSLTSQFIRRSRTHTDNILSEKLQVTLSISRRNAQKAGRDGFVVLCCIMGNLLTDRFTDPPPSSSSNQMKTTRPISRAQAYCHTCLQYKAICESLAFPVIRLFVSDHKPLHKYTRHQTYIQTDTDKVTKLNIHMCCLLRHQAASQPK